jgi:hypothetical protein
MTKFRTAQALAAVALASLAAPRSRGSFRRPDCAPRRRPDAARRHPCRQRGGHHPGVDRRPAQSGRSRLPGFRSGGHHPDPLRTTSRCTGSPPTTWRSTTSPHGGPQGHVPDLPGLFMDVYPSRRSAAMPERIYEATRRIAATTHLIEGATASAAARRASPSRSRKTAWSHLEPPRALPHRQRAPHHRAGAGDPRRQLHHGDVHRRVPRLLRPGRGTGGSSTTSSSSSSRP